MAKLLFTFFFGFKIFAGTGTLAPVVTCAFTQGDHPDFDKIVLTQTTQDEFNLHVQVQSMAAKVAGIDLTDLNVPGALNGTALPAISQTKDIDIAHDLQLPIDVSSINHASDGSGTFDAILTGNLWHPPDRHHIGFHGYFKPIGEFADGNYAHVRCQIVKSFLERLNVMVASSKPDGHGGGPAKTDGAPLMKR